jgi:ABC-type transport system involved in cytochrome c biogenesis ATPase subunit
MATVHDPIAPQIEEVSTRPNLRIVGLHIRGLRAIRSLDLPEDGLGWEEQVPELVIVGGVNGSGKTTLLEFLVSALQSLVDPRPSWMWTDIPDSLAASEAWVDFQIEVPGVMRDVVRFVFGDEAFFRQHAQAHCFGFMILQGVSQRVINDPIVNQLHGWLRNRDQFAKLRLPGVVYLPSEARTLALLEERYKTPGRMPNRDQFIFHWNPPKEWKDSLEARLYGARWDDLNAKEEGRPQEAHHFDAYSHAFERFFEGTKRLKWERGDLIVETRGGAKHDLSELSSGEKQVIVLMAELLRHWRPGSLVLIDEPELHLHSSWESKLWETLTHWQRERGGQVIVATQSTNLFMISDPGNKVLLGGKHL